MNRRPVVLVIAGSDSSGGAGLIRDVQVLSDLGVDSLCAITAVTAQSDSQVRAVHLMPAELVRAQISAALATRPVDAIKIGMLGNRAIVEAVAQCLPARTAIPIVLDPVLVSSSGGVLLDARGRTALLEKLLPQSTLVTPNVPEIAALLGSVEMHGLGQMVADEDGHPDVGAVLAVHPNCIGPTRPNRPIWSSSATKRWPA